MDDGFADLGDLLFGFAGLHDLLDGGGEHLGNDPFQRQPLEERGSEFDEQCFEQDDSSLP
jgi:hypothetical protein